MAVYTLGQQSGTTPEQHRLGLSAFMLATGAAPLDRRTGIFPAPGAATLSNVSAMTARIAPFVGWADGTSGVRQGGYPFVNDDNADVTFDPGEAGVARIDRIIAQVRDDPYDSSGVQDARVRILKGQPSGAATALPPSSILLYETTVPAGASAGGGGFNITAASVAKFPYTVGAGGLLPVRDATDLAALTPYEGQRVHRLDESEPQLYRGGQWLWDGPPLTARRTTDSSPVNNTATMVNDAQLTIAVRPNAVYEFTGYIVYRSNDTADFSYQFNVPTGATFTHVPAGVSAATTSDAGTLRMPATAAFARVLGAGGGIDMALIPSGTLVTGSNTGDFQLRWGQAVATAVDTSVRANSWIRLKRIG